MVAYLKLNIILLVYVVGATVLKCRNTNDEYNEGIVLAIPILGTCLGIKVGPFPSPFETIKAKEKHKRVETLGGLRRNY